MADPYFFGYGSLVNLATHDFPTRDPAKLKGWRRAWRHTDLRPVAFLTAVPDPESEIEGMIAHVPKNDWAALDEREWAYDRIPQRQEVTHPLTHEVEIAVYAVPQGRTIPNQQPSAVAQLYRRGRAGVSARIRTRTVQDRFFATTDGWDAPILNDRAEPRYPRHQQLKPTETEFVDDRLHARISARFRADRIKKGGATACPACSNQT